MKHHEYLIAGGGTAAGYCVKELIDKGVKGSAIGVVTMEQDPPSDRPPLSKGFLKGEQEAEDALIKPLSFYEENDVRLYCGTAVTGLQPEAHKLLVAPGDEIGFDKLLIATGAKPRTFNGPGTDNIHYLRSLQDARALRDAAAKAVDPIVIGAGFIGMEVAASLAERGLRVRLLYPEDQLMPALFTPRMSSFFSGYFEKKGVVLLPGTRMERFSGAGVEIAVHTEKRDVLMADLIAAGIGVDPVTDIFEDTGLEIDEGIIVNRKLETSFKDIYAAGDVARLRDAETGKSRRVEHWQNAFNQGRIAAANLLGEEVRDDCVPYFFSDVFDLSWEFWGETRPGSEAYHVGDVEEGAFSVWWVDDDSVIGGFTMNRGDEERETLKSCVERGCGVPDEHLNLAQPVMTV
jgi:3-phenylpropionate/trans-cinnamate dioxygenase ferredoxin reductase component